MDEKRCARCVCPPGRDWKTGDSLCYGFLGFDSDEACEQAYLKMNNVLIDDRRIKVRPPARPPLRLTACLLLQSPMGAS